MAMKKSGVYGVAVLAMMVAGPGLAQEAPMACCVGEPHWSPKAAAGLGDSAPLASNVSQSSRWGVYKFERGGFTYLQINDRTGKVRAIIGNEGTLFWALPAGGAADRVSLPGEVLPIPAGAKRAELYNNGRMVLAAYESAGGILWSVEAPDGTR